MASVFENIIHQIVGSGNKVCQNLDNGFLESVCYEALEKEFQNQQIPFIRQHDTGYQLGLFIKFRPSVHNWE